MRKYINIVTESPLGDYHIFGNFDKPGSIRSGQERKLIQNGKIRFERILTKTSFHINLYFINLDNNTVDTINNSIDLGYKPDDLAIQEKYSGEISQNTLLNVFGVSVKNDPSGISFVLASGAGGLSSPHVEKLTPWMIFHRMIHVIPIEGGFFKYFFQNWHTLLLQSTMKTARNNNLLSTDELLLELLVQYLFDGKITLKSNIEMENILNKLAKKVFDFCNGKIFLGI